MSRAETRNALLAMALGTAAFVVLGLVGRASTVPGELLAMVWPAAGAAVVMVGQLPRRWLPAGAVVLGLATFGFNAGTGLPTLLSASFAVPNVCQGVVGALLLRSMAPHLALVGGHARLQTFRDYLGLIVVAAVSSLAAVVAGTVTFELTLGTWTLVSDLVWWGRNTVGALMVLTVAGLLLGEAERADEVGGGAHPSRRPGWYVELVALYAVTAVLYTAVFSDLTALDHAFPLLVPTVWAGLRFGVRAVVAHTLVCVVVVVVATRNGRGAFGDLGSAHETALIVQSYLALVFCLGLLLALASQDRRRLARTLGRAHAEATNQTVLLSTVIESMREGVAVLDDQGRPLLENRASLDLLRSTPDATGREAPSPFEIRDVGGQPVPLELWPFARALRGEEVVGQELQVCFEDGAPERDISVSARRLPFNSDEGRPQTVVIYHDITAERAQRVALESFARTVAHDLKGPLATVEGWSELLVADATDRELVPGAEVAQMGGRISRAAATMRQLIRDLLESSTSRDQQLRVTEVDLRQLVEQVADQHRAVVDGSAPRILVAADLPAVRADEPQVRQLLHNLVGNACKYVAAGEVADIEVTARHLQRQVEVVVADRGIGIPAGRHGEVFAIFSRAHDLGEGYEGQGIGLSVCKTIVTRHGGSIHARPRAEGLGTEFVFTLPAVEPAPTPAW